MKKKTNGILVILLASLAIGSWGHAHGYKHSPNAVIHFDKGQSELTQANKDKLNKVVNDGKAMGQIDTIEVAVWSDEPFPANNEDLSKPNRDLADARAKNIENYLKDSKGVTSVKVFNMAESSNWLARAFKTDTAELKSVFNKESSPPMARHEFNIILDKGAPSEAVIIVKRKR